MNPIITSLCDVDWYKFTMAQFIRVYAPRTEAVFTFHCRTKNARLLDWVDEKTLRHEFHHAQTLRFTREELEFLRERGMSEPFLRFLKRMSLPPIHVERDEENRTFWIYAKGPWAAVTFWEDIVLSVVNELYYRGKCALKSRAVIQGMVVVGRARLEKKLALLPPYPLSIVEFGTRRRFSRDWQYYTVLPKVANRLGERFRGTSNTAWAMEFGAQPAGTMAHELFMGFYALAQTGEARQASHDDVLKKWFELYGEEQAVALTDTFGTDFFFRDFVSEAARWRGVRHDSGDPVAFGERTIQFYESLGIDPKTKLIVFSDGLTAEVICDLYHRFSGRIQTSFGWGTNLTNDLGMPALSMVMKLTEANGRPSVKLSDNLAKATGPKDEVDRARRLFGYTGSFSEECVY